MATTPQDIAWESCLIEPSADRELEGYARRRQGIPNPAIRYFAPVPWLARALVDLHPEYGLLMHLEQSVADLIALVVSQENSCRFCYAAVRAMLWSQGMSLARIQRVEEDLTRADLPRRAVAAIAFGRSQSRTGPGGGTAAREGARLPEWGAWYCRARPIEWRAFRRRPSSWFLPGSNRGIRMQPSPASWRRPAM